MKKRSEIGDSSKKAGCTDWKARKRTWQYGEHLEGVLPVFLLVATVAVGYS